MKDAVYHLMRTCHKTKLSATSRKLWMQSCVKTVSSIVLGWFISSQSRSGSRRKTNVSQNKGEVILMAKKNLFPHQSGVAVNVIYAIMQINMANW